MRPVCWTGFNAERESFKEIESRKEKLWRRKAVDDQKPDKFETKRMIKNNQDITGVQCIKNDDDVLAVSYHDKK